MPVDLSTIAEAMKTLGVPTAYLVVTLWLLLREQARTKAAEQRIAELQEKVFALSQGLVTAALKNEAAINSLLHAQPGGGSNGKPTV